ncbi:MAG: hypothetical protein HW421_2993 [Ignavibacteria bacterium]|nr:hypothetical protein [Ignavibacteria bacterium]
MINKEDVFMSEIMKNIDREPVPVELCNKILLEINALPLLKSASSNKFRKVYLLYIIYIIGIIVFSISAPSFLTQSSPGKYSIEIISIQNFLVKFIPVFNNKILLIASFSLFVLYAILFIDSRFGKRLTGGKK